MAENASNHIDYYFKIDASRTEDLFAIRCWTNLKFGIDQNSIWVTGFDFAQINSVEVKSIPYKTIYHEKSNKLFLINSLLPDRNVPSVLWSPISRAIPVTLPSLNHNYFGVDASVKVRLVQYTFEKDSLLMITSISALNQYVQEAPSHRLAKLKWTIINNDKACLIGNPILPIKGDVYWNLSNSFLPSGYNFEFPLLVNEIEQLIDSSKKSFIIWNLDNSYALIDKNDFEVLSISAFRLSLIKNPLNF